MILSCVSVPPLATALIRETPEDFQVEEELGFEPDGTGGHALLRVRKRGLNTEQVADRLARLAGVRRSGVGYAGLKDRNALTTQWFSVGLGGLPEPHWGTLADGRIEVLETARHRRKLRRGALRGNRFRLTLRALHGDPDELTRRLERVAARGVPNYFGEQRFGRDNLERARLLFQDGLKVDRHRRGLYLSAARAYLFNRVLSLRVERNCWDRALAGEALVLNGTRSFFMVGTPDGEIRRRVASGDIHPSGPLWGRGAPASSEDARRIEGEALAGCELWCRGLEAWGLEQQRRALRTLPGGMSWTLDSEHGVLGLDFTLPAGAYATSVLREIVAYRESGVAPEE